MITRIACLLLIAGTTFAQNTSFGTGTFLVGVDIVSGLYRSSPETILPCYWERLSGLGGTIDEIIASGFSEGPTIVKIASSDYAFKSSGCTQWNLVEQQARKQQQATPRSGAILAAGTKHLPPPCATVQLKPPQVAYCPEPYIRLVPVKSDDMFDSAWYCRTNNYTMAAIKGGSGCGGGGFDMVDGKWALPGKPPPPVTSFPSNIQRKHIPGDKLEIKECYALIAPMTRMSGINLLDGIKVPKGNVICVRDILTIKGERYYKVQIMKIGTLDRSQHITAWVKVKRLMEHGVWLS